MTAKKPVMTRDQILESIAVVEQQKVDQMRRFLVLPPNYEAVRRLKASVEAEMSVLLVRERALRRALEKAKAEEG